MADKMRTDSAGPATTGGAVEGQPSRGPSGEEFAVTGVAVVSANEPKGIAVGTLWLNIGEDGEGVINVRIQDPSDSTRLCKFDPLRKVVITQDPVHNEIHNGTSFSMVHVDTAMNNADSFVLVFKTPDGTTRAHMVIEFSTLAGGHVDIIEGPTWDTNTGTDVTIFNRKRLDVMTSSVLLEDKTATPAFTATDKALLDPTAFAGGIIIHTIYAFGITARQTAVMRGTTEWLLKPDTTYGIRFTADGANNGGQLVLNWYEHTDE